MTEQTEEPRATTSQGTATAGLSDAYGWDHHHTIVRETRRNGSLVVTEDFIRRAGPGTVRFPCCEAAAWYTQYDGQEFGTKVGVKYWLPLPLQIGRYNVEKVFEKMGLQGSKTSTFRGICFFLNGYF